MELERKIVKNGVFASSVYEEKLESLDSVKGLRQEQVNNIVVETESGKRLDGDDIKSQERMMRPVLITLAKFLIEQYPELGEITTGWVDAENKPQSVSINEFVEALEKAGLEQTNIWLKG